MLGHRRLRTFGAGLALACLGLAGCAGQGVGQGGDAETGTLTYWMWDAAQLPGYQRCAEDFEAQNPEIDVKIEQFGWADYWNKLMTGFVGDSAPDVFVDHTSRFGEFAERGLIEPVDDVVEAEDIDLSAYVPGSAELWVGPDGRRYGLPKDFDTVGLFYNTEMAEEAGLAPEQLADLTWNPDDGGTYEDVIARMTVDRNGVRGDEPGFDKDAVATYGLGLSESGSAFGQTQWSYLAASTGWTWTDEEAWGTRFNFDDPRFQESIDWWRGLIEKGYMPPLSLTEGGSLDQQVQAGRYAMITEGSWNLGLLSGLQGVDLASVKLPVGPEGRATMTNSLADSISTASPRKGAARAWVAYLASPACQEVVARQGVVFPALSSTTPAAEEALGRTGFDVTAFTDPITDGETVPYPEFLNAAEISSVMYSAMDAVMAFDQDVDSLDRTNARIDALFD